MKRNLFSLLFSTTELGKKLNIGDTVILSHTDRGYVLRDRKCNIYGCQMIDCMDQEADNLLSFLSKKEDALLVLWDGEYSEYLDYSEVKVEAITNNHIIVIPDPMTQELLMRRENEKEDKHIDDFLSSLIEDLSDVVCDSTEYKECSCCEEVKEEKEETNMFSELGSSFGKINSNQFRLSINGLSVRGKDGKYVTFNPETRELVEVTTGFFDEMRDLLFVMPATELEVGDIILHQNKPYYVTRVRDNEVKGIDFEEAVENTLIPKTNVFGMKYFTKVFNCLGTNNILGSDLAANPMMAYALMGGNDFDLSKVMMFQALSGQGNGIADFSENPVMLMALMSNEKGGGDLGDFAKLQVLSQLSGKKKVTKETKTKE